MSRSRYHSEGWRLVETPGMQRPGMGETGLVCLDKVVSRPQNPDGRSRHEIPDQE